MSAPGQITTLWNNGVAHREDVGYFESRMPGRETWAGVAVAVDAEAVAMTPDVMPQPPVPEPSGKTAPSKLRAKTKKEAKLNTNSFI